MKMKKVLALILALALVVTSFAACAGTTTTEPSTTESSTTESSAEESTTEESSEAESTQDMDVTPVRTGATTVPTKVEGVAEADTLNFRIGMEPTGMNTTTITYADEFTMVGNMYDTLTRVQEDGTYGPAAAETIDVSDDGLTYTFHLRKDGVWTNGDTVTAEDFAFAWSEVLNPEVAAEYAYFLYFIENAEDYYNGNCEWEDVGIKVIDDFTLEVKLHTALPYALELFSFGVLAPINKNFYEAVGADLYNTEPEYFCSNGPFALVEWSHGEKLVVQKFEDYYHADQVDAQQITFKIISDANAVLNAFLSGEIDYTGVLSTGDQISMVEGAGFEVQTFPSKTYYYIYVNTENEFLQNVNLRRALSLAFDKQALCDATLGNGSVPLTCFAPGVMCGDIDYQAASLEANGGAYSPENGDLEQAQEYFATALKELGVTADQITLGIDCGDSSLAISQASFYQEAWQQAFGITVEVNSMITKQVAANRQDGNFDLSMGGWGPDYNDPISDLDLWVSDGGNNDTGWGSEEYDAQIAIARTSTDMQERCDAFIECEKIVASELPILPVYVRGNAVSLSDKITGGFIVDQNQTTYRYVQLG
ncbi:MAG: peptide ABC transporter substrate-binding protein [Clostridia bacterium]|nr:peptide ABC transporter substrate-binding protein [Clostridia bacterium]